MKAVMNEKTVSGSMVCWEMLRLVVVDGRPRYVQNSCAYSLPMIADAAIDGRSMSAESLRRSRAALRKFIAANSQ